MKKLIALCLTLTLLAPLAACGKKEKLAQVPADFSFFIIWGCGNTASYNSQTGKLVKTTDAAHPEDYVTQHLLTPEELAYVYALLEKLDVDSYPDVYDPGNGTSYPPMNLWLTVYRGAEKKTIRADGVAASFRSRNKKGQAFLSVCEAICELLTATPEWKALPDYENYYL